ncbi:MAG: hypothetical protein JWO13_3596 [Acidobacteriales bacterium]|nr:hypothetical protein [Terriglobales bacterium]
MVRQSVNLYRIRSRYAVDLPVIRSAASVLVCVCVVIWVSLPCTSQTSAQLQDYFKNSVGLTPDQITDFRNGKPVVKVIQSRTPSDIVVFGAIYIKATPESYVQLATDFDRLRKLPEYLAIQKYSSPPLVSDLASFKFESGDIKDLKECKPGHCEVQLPTKSMQAYQQAIDWSAPDVEERVNQLLQQRTIQRLQAYQREGNQALGTYDDKNDPVNESKQFESILSYAQTLPKYLPDFHYYLLSYPGSKPANVEDTFYWAKVKFGLKPTLRVVQVVTMKGQSANQPAYAIAQKQLYSSHYFQSALDLTFCIRDPDDPKHSGFYLIKAMGSEQAGLTGFKGGIVRRKAVGRTASSLEKSLATIKSTLEKQ